MWVGGAIKGTYGAASPDHLDQHRQVVLPFKEEIGAFEGSTITFSVLTSDSQVISVKTKLADTHSHTHCARQLVRESVTKQLTKGII